MAVEEYTTHGALVYRDSERTHRWYDAWGRDVHKYLQNFMNRLRLQVVLLLICQVIKVPQLMMLLMEITEKFNSN